MLDGLYLRVDDIDRRPAYNRSDGEPIVLKYSNTRLVDPEVLLFSLHTEFANMIAWSDYMNRSNKLNTMSDSRVSIMFFHCQNKPNLHKQTSQPAVESKWFRSKKHPETEERWMALCNCLDTPAFGGLQFGGARVAAWNDSHMACLGEVKSVDPGLTTTHCSHSHRYSYDIDLNWWGCGNWMKLV